MTLPPATNPEAGAVLDEAFGRLTSITEGWEDHCGLLVDAWRQTGQPPRRLPAELRRRVSLGTFPAKLDGPVRDALRSELIQRNPGNRLELEIHQLVAGLNSLQKDPGACRRIVQLALDRDSQPREFRRCLIRAGLSAPRASEIISVIKAPEVAREFVNGKLSVRTALLKARLAPARSATGVDGEAKCRVRQTRRRIESVLRRLLALVAQAKLKQPERTCWPILAGMYRLKFTPAALASTPITPS